MDENTESNQADANKNEDENVPDTQVNVSSHEELPEDGQVHDNTTPDEGQTAGETATLAATDTTEEKTTVSREATENQLTDKPNTPGDSSHSTKEASDLDKRPKSDTRRQSAVLSKSPNTGARRGSVKPGSRPDTGKKSPVQHGENGIVESPMPIFRPKMPTELFDGLMSLFLATKSQEIFECVGDTHVSEDNPFKLLKKEDILKDMFNRGAVSDFTPIKKIINEYPGDEILIGYDREFKFGNNFIIAINEEAKERLLRVPTPAEGETGREEKSPAPKVIYRYIPPVSKPWVSMGSEKEIEEETVSNERIQIKMSVKRKRKNFGAPCAFIDRNVGDAKDGYIECTATEDKTFSLKRLELTKATQAIPVFHDRPAQTDWKFPRNNTTQYTPREFDEKTIDEISSSKSMQTFAKTVTSYFEVLLQQNEITDIMVDDYLNLGEEDDSFGSKSDTHLKEYQSFTDLQFSKEKTITCIDWHPSIKGIVGVSIGEKMSFDTRIDELAKVIMTPSLVLIWSFADPIHPQLLLEAPDDILCFKFMPTDPNIIAGGCINGQVVLWNISEHFERLKAPRSGKKKTTAVFPGLEDSSLLETPIVRYCAVSSIEHSHRSPITDLIWVPDHFEVTKVGIALENKTGQCVQLMTASIDHNIIFWDIRPPKVGQQHQQDQASAKTNPFKYLDLTWKPHLKVTLFKSEPGGDHSPIKFCMAERQGDRSILSEPDEEYGKHGDQKKDAAGAGSFQFGKKDSDRKALKKLNTHLYVGTEDGELVYVDWMPQKDQDTGKLQTPKPDFYHTFHDGPILSIQRSPFFKDVILCVGGWNFTIWKEGVNSGPILNPSANNKQLTGGYWSPTRPSIFYITRADGTIDIWDLLDKTHEPLLHQNITPSPITCIFIQQVSSKQQLLGIGDDTGTLHILEVPWSLRQPVTNELQSMTNYIEREVKRRAFVMARWDFREQEKMEMEMEAKRKAGIAPNVVLTDEEIEFRMKQEYQAYLDEEQNFLRALGLKEEVLEPLPADK